MTLVVHNILKERIRTQGPITVVQYLETCVSHYYATHQPFGKMGDFITAPEVSPAFGEILAAWLMDRWESLGSPKDCILLELGPGRGTLMKDMVQAAQIRPSFLKGARILFLESSPLLRQIQRETIPSCQHLETLQNLPPLPLFFVANEFFDALPIHQEVLINGAWQERHVGLDHRGKLVFLEHGPIRESCPAAQTFAQELANHLANHGGAGLVIDYGYGNGETGETLQGVKNHAYHDVLKNPGAVDLTAHVDFQKLAHPFQNSHLSLHLWTQGEFLLTHGLSLRATASTLNRLTASDQMGSLFKVLTVSHSPASIQCGDEGTIVDVI